MHKRVEHIVSTPAVLVALTRNGIAALQRYTGHRRVLAAAALLLGFALVALGAMLWENTAPYRALKSYRTGDFNRSAALFSSAEENAARYNAANAWYRAGEYDRALSLYSAIASGDADFAARVWFNRGNTLIRLKEFAKARDAFARSLTYRYDVQALENMMHILYAESQDHMLTGRQEGKKRAQEQAAENTQERRSQKTGGGSEQPSSAERNRGAGSQGRKVERDPQLEFSNKGKSRLSSKQYELINQRSVHETNPW